jgi:hypothetical protein
VLKTIFNYKEENIEFIHDRKELLNDVSAQHFLERLDKMVMNSKLGYDLFVYLSGHGTNPIGPNHFGDNGEDNTLPESQSLVCSSAYQKMEKPLKVNVSSTHFDI